MQHEDRELLTILALALWVLVLLFALSAIGILAPSTARAEAPTPCQVTERQFMAAAGQKALVATPKATVAILGEINRMRVAAGVFPLQADRITVVPRQVGGQTMLGVVMVKDSCVLLDMARTFPVEAWMTFLGGLGLSQDDFVREMHV